MKTATLTSNAAGLIDVGNALQATRDQVTCGGETRSQLYRRLKAEIAWSQAEALKETERQRCRSAGMTKAAAGQAAWDAVARNYPPVDAVTWGRLMMFIDNPPVAPAELPDLSVLWSTVMAMTGALSLRCHEIGQAVDPLIEAIAHRRSLEDRATCFNATDEVQRQLQAAATSPLLVIEGAVGEFNRYQVSESEYSVAVHAELAKFNDVLKLLPKSIDQQWKKTIGWLCGSDALRVQKYLLRVHAREANRP